jgi:hypothetical protein
MRFTTILALVATPILVTATHDPATSNTKGYKPKSLNCSGKPPSPNKVLPTAHPILTSYTFPPPQHQKPQKQSKPPNAATTPASQEPKPSPSSKQTTNTTRTTVLHTGHAARTRALRRHTLNSRLTRIIGCFIGGMRGRVAGMGLGVLRIRILESVGVRIRMGRLWLGVIVAPRVDGVAC